jgi:Tfp pilus assembly protein PilN
MSRTSLPAASLAASRTVAALHESGGRWHAVVVQGHPGRLLEARTIAVGASRELDEVIRRTRAERLVRLIPGPRAIARCVSIPQAAPAEAAAALALIAEAELPESIPAHRRAAGVIVDAPANGTLTGLLTGWPVRDGEQHAAASTAAPESWVAQPVALALLRGPSGLAAYADADEGSISIVAGGPSRTIARVLVEDNSDPNAWAESVRRALAETGQIVGLEAPGSSAMALVLGPQAAENLAGTTGGKSSDPAWLDTFGLALGAAMAALSNDPSLRALTGLSAEAPRERRRAAGRVLWWLSDRRNATRAAVVAAAAMLLVPLGLAWARAAVLEAKVGTLRQQESSREDLARSAALYEQLQKSRWPMTKLLADVSGALPLGVRVEAVRLSPDQGLGLEATADTAQAVGVFQENLNKSGIFRDVRIARHDTAPGGIVTFEIEAAVASPFLAARPAEDFAATPLAVKLYGEGASNTHWAAESDTAARPVRAERAARSEEPNNDDDDGPESPSRPSAAGSDEVPGALTDEQIKAMDRGAAMKEWSGRKRYVQVNDKKIDQATKDRLAAEIEKLGVQMKAAQ